MKKIVGILGMAAVLASGAFAAEPAANFVMAEFTGSMDFGWKADFADSDNVKMGMYNTPDATLKFGFIDAGDKTTTGDGIWGELKIKAGGTSVKNGVSKLGDNKFDENTIITHDADADATNMYLPNLFPVPTVDVAKIHFVDGDFSAALNIKAPDLAYGEFSAPAATGSTVKTNKIDANGSLSNGFALEVAMDKMFALNFKLKDNGLNPVKNDGKKIGLAVDASLKAIDNLDFTVAGAFNFGKGEEYTGFATSAGYKFNINDTLYVKPGVAYTMGMKKDADALQSIEAGVLLGWGAVDQEPGFKYVSNKTTEGVSLAVSNNLNFDAAVGFGSIDPSDPDKKDEFNDWLKNNANMTTIVAGLYDASLFKFLNLDTDVVGTLKVGAVNETTMTSVLIASGEESARMTWTDNKTGLGLKYDVNVKPVYISLGGDMQICVPYSVKLAYDGPNAPSQSEIDEAEKQINKEVKKAVGDTYVNTAWSVKIGSKEVIDNTDLYVLYAGAYDGAKEKITTNEISIGTKISF